MSDWKTLDDLLSGWRITPPAGGGSAPRGGVFPRYRGAFEPDEAEPEVLRVAGRIFFDEDGRPGATTAAAEIVPPVTAATAAESAAAPATAAAATVAATARFRARREFAVSVEVDPEVWKPAGRSRGWHVFAAGDSVAGRLTLLGLWSSLPASWLAQEPDGTPLPPPWRELWTFGKDHTWCCRLAVADPDDPDAASSFLETCLVSRVTKTAAGRGRKFKSENLKKELESKL